MGKNKLVKFAEYDAHPFTFDATCALKGKWNKELFGNDNPIVLELACGKGRLGRGRSGSPGGRAGATPLLHV